MTRPRVLVLSGETLFRSFFDPPRARRLGRGFAWTRVADRRVTPRLRRLLADADALVTTWDSPRFGEELLSLAPRLRLVAHCGGEVKARFARPLFERLVIANAPGPMAHRVAELAVTFLLMAARRVDAYREALRRPSNRVYARLHLEGAGKETLRERTVGLLGFGRIGQETARLLRPFGPRLLVHDPYVATAAVRARGGAPVTFARILRESEYLVLAAGLTDATRGLLDRAALRLLPDGATVVNVARGGIVDLEALTAEQRAFVEMFVRLDGKLNWVSQELKVSYPTVRSRLDEVIRAMGHEVHGAPPAEEKARAAEQRQAILDALAAGKIDSAEAISQLQGL